MPKRQRRRIKTEERSRAPVMTPLAAAVITALYPVGSAIAQDDQDPAAGAEIEEIVVTGSRPGALRTWPRCCKRQPSQPVRRR
jgi:hypothetical protein